MNTKKKISILGAGESGVGSAILAKKKEFDVFVSDFGSIKNQYLKLLKKHRIDFESGKHSTEKILNSDLIVKSPGISNQTKIVQAIQKKSIPIVSEIEFAAAYTSAKLIGITGTNGKTTTTLLTHHLLKKAGLKAGLAGNIGKSFALQVAQENYDFYVLELSSFQLDDMFDTKLDFAILTNITPDHLDRYDYKMENYIASKFRIIQNQNAEDFFIYNNEDPIIQQKIKATKILARHLTFKDKSLEKINSCLKNNFKLKGNHNANNAKAAILVAQNLGISTDKICTALKSFEHLEHRMQFVAEIHGVEFINDSKATNVDATFYALEALKKPIVWILGGIDKGNDYSVLKPFLKKIKAIVCLGKDNQKIIRYFENDIDTIVETHSMIDAVQASKKIAAKGDVVLLSPACASFDLFENYEARGKEFQLSVKIIGDELWEMSD